MPLFIARGAHRPRSRVRGASTVTNCSGAFPPQTASPKEQGWLVTITWCVADGILSI